MKSRKSVRATYFEIQKTVIHGYINSFVFVLMKFELAQSTKGASPASEQFEAARNLLLENTLGIVLFADRL
jgi:hypothetical protein